MLAFPHTKLGLPELEHPNFYEITSSIFLLFLFLLAIKKIYITLFQNYKPRDCLRVSFSLQKTCLKALHLQAVHRRLKDMRLKLAEDLFQRHVIHY